jgi:lipopolysaccharide heptosyltransferase II
MRILCICPIGIGNYLLVYPACSFIKKRRPDVSLHLLALRQGMADLAGRDTLWDAVHVFDPDRPNLTLAQKAAIVKDLRRQRFDACLNLFPSNKWLYNLLPFLCSIPIRVGFTYHYRPLTSLPFLLTRRLPVDPMLHDARQNMALARFFLGESVQGVNGEMVFPKLYTADDEAWAAKCIHTSARQRHIAIHPGSSADHGMIFKRWPAERFATLADKLCERLSADAYVLGGGEEEDLKREVCASMKQPSTLVVQATLGRTAALLNKCDLCLCNDSGLMHVASCQNVPTIAVFGPTDERRNGPAGKNSLVVRKTMSGFPLWTVANVGNRSVPRGVDPRASLLALGVDEAWVQVEPWLGRMFQSV